MDRLCLLHSKSTKSKRHVDHCLKFYHFSTKLIGRSINLQILKTSEISRYFLPSIEECHLMHYNSDPGVVLYYTGLMFPDACIAFCFCFFIYNFFLHILLALVTSKLETWFETSLCNACCRHSANFLHLKYYTLTLMLFDSWNNKQLKTLLPRTDGKDFYFLRISV